MTNELTFEGHTLSEIEALIRESERVRALPPKHQRATSPRRFTAMNRTPARPQAVSQFVSAVAESATMTALDAARRREERAARIKGLSAMHARGFSTEASYRELDTLTRDEADPLFGKQQPSADRLEATANWEYVNRPLSDWASDRETYVLGRLSELQGSHRVFKRSATGVKSFVV